MKTNITIWKGDYIYLLPNIAICFDKDCFQQYVENISLLNYPS